MAGFLLTLVALAYVSSLTIVTVGNVRGWWRKGR